MTWNTLPPATRATAEQLLTRKQLDILKLHLAGYGIRRISLALDISPSTVRSHLDRATQKLAPHIGRDAA